MTTMEDSGAMPINIKDDATRALAREVIRIVLEPRSASFRLVCMPKRLRADDERGVDNRDSPTEAALPQIGVPASSQ